MAFNQIKLFFRSRVVQHLAFWIFAFLVLAGFFGKEYGDPFLKLNLIYTLLFLTSILIVVYLNLLLLIPTFLQKGKWLIYSLFLMALIALGIGLNWFTFEYLHRWLFPEYYFISFYSVLDLFNFVVIFLAATSLLKLAKGWFELNRQKKKVSLLEKEKLDAELNALKSQINPHFLFNSLNSMYSLSLDNDPKVPDLLLKLSSGMRYMLYETNENFVPLEKELEYLNNYLELQRLRTDQQTPIRFEVKGTVSDQKVAPLIFIPFVENAFKHGIKGDIENVYIDLSLTIGQQELVFKIENNKGIIDELPLLNSVGGIGLQNVKKRLALLYGATFDLSIKNTETCFNVFLQLPLK